MEMLIADPVNCGNIVELKRIVNRAIYKNKKKIGPGFVKGSVRVGFNRSLSLEEIAELRELAQSKGARKFVPYGDRAYATIIFRI